MPPEGFVDLSAYKHSLDDLCDAQLKQERETINLIASDNAMPGWRSSKAPYKGDMIQEGIVNQRPFAGANYHDQIEILAAEVAGLVFGSDCAMLQSHSCSQANQAVFQALIPLDGRAMALSFRAGGHLTHGMKSNFSGRLYKFTAYGLNAQGLIDYAELESRARELMPAVIVCGSSSYPHLYEVAELRRICDAIGAKLVLDLSHEAGLIAGGAFPLAPGIADAVTMSMDKTLRGPHGALILSRREIFQDIQKAVFPGTQSSFPIRRLTDATQALLESQTRGFSRYAAESVLLAQYVDRRFGELTGSEPLGTAKHYSLIDTRRRYGLTGQQAEKRLEALGILTNQQTLPSDASGRLADSGGLRLGTAWLASCGYTISEVEELVQLMHGHLSGDLSTIDGQRAVRCMTSKYRSRDIRRKYDPAWLM